MLILQVLSIVLEIIIISVNMILKICYVIIRFYCLNSTLMLNNVNILIYCNAVLSKQTN